MLKTLKTHEIHDSTLSKVGTDFLELNWIDYGGQIQFWVV